MVEISEKKMKFQIKNKIQFIMMLVAKINKEIRCSEYRSPNLV